MAVRLHCITIWSYTRSRLATAAATLANREAPTTDNKTDFSTRQISDQRKRKITGLLVNFIVKDMRPLAAVSGNGFKDIIHFFEPGYIIPSHRTLWNNITHQYDELRVQLATEMYGGWIVPGYPYRRRLSCDINVWTGVASASRRW